MPEIVEISKSMTETELLRVLGDPSQKVKGGRALVLDTQNWSESEYLEKYTEAEVSIEVWVWKREEATYIITLSKVTRQVTRARIKRPPVNRDVMP